MPCNLIRTTTVELAHADRVLLARALHKLGIIAAASEDIQLAQLARYYDGEKLLLFGPANANEVKQAYSREVVRSTAQRFGWRLTEKSPTQFVAQKRG